MTGSRVQKTLLMNSCRLCAACVCKLSCSAALSTGAAAAEFFSCAAQDTTRDHEEEWKLSALDLVSRSSALLQTL